MKTIKKLKTKLRFIKNSMSPILRNIKVDSESLVCTDHETSVKIKDNYSMSPGLQEYDKLGLLDSVEDDIEDYPLIDFNIKCKHCITTETKVLEDLVRYASNDERRPYLNAIAIDRNHLVATSGYILKSVEIDVDVKDNYLLPRTSIKILIGLLKGFKVKSVKVQVNDTYAVINNEHFTLTMRLVQLEYIKWSSVVPVKFKNSFTVDKWIDFKEIKPLFDKRNQKCIVKTVDGNIILTPERYPNNQYIIGKTDLEFEMLFNINFLDIAANKCKTFEVKFNNSLTAIFVNGAVVMPLNR